MAVKHLIVLLLGVLLAIQLADAHRGYDSYGNGRHGQGYGLGYGRGGYYNRGHGRPPYVGGKKPCNRPSTPTAPEPTTLAPTAPEPTTLAPTAPEPTTLAPTAPEPTTLAPTAPEPTTLAPTAPEPTTLAPIAPEPTTLAP